MDVLADLIVQHGFDWQMSEWRVDFIRWASFGVFHQVGLSEVTVKDDFHDKNISQEQAAKEDTCLFWVSEARANAGEELILAKKPARAGWRVDPVGCQLRAWAQETGGILPVRREKTLSLEIALKSIMPVV